MEEEDVDFVAEDDILDLMLAKAERLAQQMKASASSSSSYGSQDKGTLPSSIEMREDHWTECSSVDLLTTRSSTSTTIKLTVESLYNDGNPQQSMETITIPRDSSSITSSACSQERIDVAVHTAKLMEIEVQTVLMSEGVKELIGGQEKISYHLQDEVILPTIPPSMERTPTSIMSSNVTNSTQNEEDDVPIADYSPPRIVRRSGSFLPGDCKDENKNNNNSISTHESTTMMIQWVKVSNAKKGDCDYVPVSDYSPQKMIYNSDDSFDILNFVTQNRCRPLKKKRRRRKFIVVCLSLVCLLVAAVAHYRLSALLLSETETTTNPENSSDVLYLGSTYPEGLGGVSNEKSLDIKQVDTEMNTELTVCGKFNAVIIGNHTDVNVHRAAQVEQEVEASISIHSPETRFCNHPLYQLFLPLGCPGEERTEIDNEIKSHMRQQKLEQLIQGMMQ